MIRAAAHLPLVVFVSTVFENETSRDDFSTVIIPASQRQFLSSPAIPDCNEVARAANFVNNNHGFIIGYTSRVSGDDVNALIKREEISTGNGGFAETAEVVSARAYANCKMEGAILQRHRRDRFIGLRSEITVYPPSPRRKFMRPCTM